MNIVTASTTARDITFKFGANYGTITESQYELQIKENGAIRFLGDSEITFTSVVQPVAPTYDVDGNLTNTPSEGSMVASIAFTNEAIYSVSLLKNTSTYNKPLVTFTVKAINPVTAITARTIQ